MPRLQEHGGRGSHFLQLLKLRPTLRELKDRQDAAPGQKLADGA